jgi:UDP-N-acetylglucosamine diphosphorylase / glucose-1-phosphate thymidylyltransferase / UDP-N-acetylgalactosamine diphosphorylase / glucosamine-1-phosphate N-acetyltransferase / galactosamine-1-phosphate N-acetyltransferase
MAELKLYLYDDDTARDWQPFALTRPVGELLLGAYTFRARAERLLGVPCAGHITAGHLGGFMEEGAAPVVAATSVQDSSPRLFLSSRAIIDWGWSLVPPDTAAVLRCNDDIVGWYAPAGEATPATDWFTAPDASVDHVIDVPGRVLQRVWDLVAENPAQIERDFAAADRPGAATVDVEGAGQFSTIDVEGVGRFSAIDFHDDRLHLGADVTIEPGVVLDFSSGPIWLDDGVTVRAFTRLAGPAYVGPDSTLLGGPYAAISVGPVCKVHGEIEESIILGYSNKAHDGFLGHAYLGRWVNLGAMTTNSDLKNNYGSIRMWTPRGDADTGLIKLGCLLGDYVKTGIGSLLNTGTVVGAGSNLYGTEMPPKYVPPFSWGSGSELVPFDREKFLALTETVMKRRKLSLSDGMREMLGRAWEIGRDKV